MNSKNQSGQMVALLALILELTTVTLIILSHANAATISVAKPGCEQQCGSITIPYPFGFGNSNCYYDQWFEIECKHITTNNETTTAAGSRPFLKRVNLEVLELRIATSSDPTGWIYVNSPIVASSPNCSAGKPSTSAAVVNLTGSPFYYSSGFNSFGAAGCNNEVWMTGGSQVVGCNSTCKSNTGMGNCCKTAVPKSLRVFKVSFGNPAAAGCKYGFIAQSKWFTWYPSSTCNAAVLDSDSVPAWLEWGIFNSTPEAAALAEQSARDNSPVGCTDYSYEDGFVLQYCYCSQGFQGNPYLPNGCQDIDECLDPPSDCKGTCKNTLGSYKCSGAKTVVIHIVIKVVSPFVVVLLIIVTIWLIFNRIKSREKQKFFKQNGGLLLSKAGNTKIYTVKELKKATNNFHRKNELGKGGQGTVYKGMLSIDGHITAVAVKKCKGIIEQANSGTSTTAQEEDDHNHTNTNIHMNEFITEVINLSKTKHNNIVKLLGCCLETEAPMLVYEHVANGDLYNHLKSKRDFPWKERLKIAAEAAGGLSYLHSDAEVRIVHRDIKSANILLDNRNIAKIADFGISKSVSADQALVKVAAGQGTDGYRDPQHIGSGQYSDKSDVYSFGVVLAELLTGEKPVRCPEWQEVKDQTVTLLADDFMSKEFEEMWSGDFLHPVVRVEALKSEIEAVVKLVKLCLKPIGSERPTMKQVFNKLTNIKNPDRDTNGDDAKGTLQNTNASPIEDQQTQPLIIRG